MSVASARKPSSTLEAVSPAGGLMPVPVPTSLSHPAVTTWTIVNPAACATGVDDSAPRVTVQLVPDTLVTRINSDGAAGSPT